jgi:hypothetical protein
MARRRPPTRCAKPSPDESSHSQHFVSVTQFACGKPGLLGPEATETRPAKAIAPAIALSYRARSLTKPRTIQNPSNLPAPVWTARAFLFLRPPYDASRPAQHRRRCSSTFDWPASLGAGAPSVHSRPPRRSLTAPADSPTITSIIPPGWSLGELARVASRRGLFVRHHPPY